MTPNELVKFYLLARTIDWRHHLESLDGAAVAELIKNLKAANNNLRLRIEAELPQVWASYTADQGGAAVRLWLGEILTDPATQLENTITESWTISAQQSLAAYNDILSFGGMAKNIATIPITLEAITGLVSKKLFAGYTLQELIGKAFTEGQIASVIQALDTGIANGWGYPKVIKNLKKTALDEGLQVTQRQAITLTRSYIQQASVNAQLAVYENNQDVVKGVEWCSILDNRVCPLCFEGTAEVIPFGKLRGVTKRPYIGDIVVVTTSDGLQIRATPKHPVLTLSGWCALEELNPGDQIIYAEKRDALNILGKQEINMPTKFSELFDFFSSQSFSEIKRYRTTTDAFNGDSGILNDQIATICKNRFLKSNVSYPALAQFIPYKGFTVDNSSLVSFFGNHSFDSLFNRMCAWAFGLSTPFNSRFFEGLPHKRCSEPALLNDLFRRIPLLIQFNYFRLFFLAILASFCSRNIWHSLIFDKQGCDCSSTSIKMFSDLSGRNSLPVHIKNVVNIGREFMFSGHVYNLHCDEELYTANGFIVKNCAATDGNTYTFEEEKPPMPRHPRCLLPDTLVYAPDIVAVFRTDYEGPVYDFQLEDGLSLSLTANHPVLTVDGFIPACRVDKNTRFICNENKLTNLLQIWALYLHAKMAYGPGEVIKLSQSSLHGDGIYTDKDVELVQTPCMKSFSYLSGRDERFELYELLECNRKMISVYEAYTDQFKLLENWYKKRPYLSFKRYVFKQERHYNGPVYDLQTLSSLYYAHGAIVSNCRCLWLPWVKSWRDLGIDKDDLERAARPWLIREKGNIDEGGNRKVLNFGTSTEDFSGWWETLDFKTQAQVIGPVRTRLINSGQLTWKDLMDKHSGKYFTLAELGFSESGEKL